MNGLYQCFMNIAEKSGLASPLGILIDWLRFADAWRDQYQPAMEEVRTGRIPFSKLDKCQQAANNTKEQFASSPDLDTRILDAAMDALSAFSSMSKQALESTKIRADIKAILLGPVGLYEALRGKGMHGGALPMPSEELLEGRRFED